MIAVSPVGLFDLPDRVPRKGYFYTYVLWNPADDIPFYVGKGSLRRVLMHFRGIEKCNRPKLKMIQQLRERGVEPSVKYAYYGPDEQEAFRIEILLIATWGRRSDGGILTNLHVGGKGRSGHSGNLTDDGRRRIADAARRMPRVVGTYHHSKEVRQKMSEIKMGKKRGAYSAEHRLHISESQMGKVISPEARVKMSAAKTGKPSASKGVKRRPLSSEHRAKISAGLKKSAKMKGSMWAPDRRRKNAYMLRALAEALRGKKKGPLSPEHRQHVTDGLKAWWAKRPPIRLTPEQHARLSQAIKDSWARRKAKQAIDSAVSRASRRPRAASPLRVHAGTGSA